MSDQYTEVSTPNGGIGEWGHVPYRAAVQLLREFYTEQLAQARAVLADIEEGQARVFHQLGPISAHNRKEVFEGPE